MKKPAVMSLLTFLPAAGVFAETLERKAPLSLVEMILTRAVVMVVLGLVTFIFLLSIYFVLEYLTPFSLKNELVRKKNPAMAVIIGAVFISIAIVFAAIIIAS